jgi:hypothetical protein
MPPIDPPEAIRNMLGNVRPLPPDHLSPISHFQLTTTEITLALRYVQSKTDRSPSKPSVANRHLCRLRQMALVGLIENLERFFKELAGVCIDAIAPLTADDRLDTFRVSGSSIAGHYGADTLGRALCESGIWLDCKTIGDRFRDILQDVATPATLPPFQVLPQQLRHEKSRYDTLQLLWQLRHTVVHNVGVITQSDAVKLRVLAKRYVSPLHTLEPTSDDIDYLADFLGEVAESCNARVCSRVEELLNRIHANDPTLIDDPGKKAGDLASQFRLPVTIAGSSAAPPP